MPAASNPVFCITVAITAFIAPVISNAQDSSTVLQGWGIYLPGSSMFTIMKKLEAQKNVVLKINASGNVSGELTTVYNTSLEKKISRKEQQVFSIQGKCDTRKNLLELVLTKAKQGDTGYIAFNKPDTLIYDLSIQQDTAGTIVLAAADKNLNGHDPYEWIGRIGGEGTGMNIADNISMHLLPLQIRMRGKLPVNPPAKQEADEQKPRVTKIQKTIIVDSSFIQLALYDNGIVDGDTATILLDGQVIMNKQAISEKAITVNLQLKKQPREHVIEMVADNLGSIPPNTALLVVTCKAKRYEINLSSDYRVNSGVRVILRN
jgi:hypothetical protein